MGDLPEARVTPPPPFQKTGCYYAGPFNVKIHTLRRAQTIKAYICLFVCLVTKAVHIEVTTDLIANGYLADLTRFVSRSVAEVYLLMFILTMQGFHQLQQRAKWTKEEPSIKMGNVVLVHKTNVPPQMWCLGRITRT